MAALSFAENLYSFHRAFVAIPARTDDEQALAAISAELAAAASAFAARRFAAAIEAYRQAEALIYAQLDPAFSVADGIDERVALPRDPKLFPALLSASLEWANLTAVKEPQSPVVGRIAPDASLLAPAQPIDQVGVVTAKLAAPGALAAVAAWRLGQTLQAQGDSQASAFFTSRAQASSGDTVKMLSANAAATPAAPKQGLLSAVSTRAPITRFATRQSAGSLPSTLTADSRTLGTLIGGAAVTFTWNAGDGPPADQVTTRVYQARVSAKELISLGGRHLTLSDVALDLPHEYYYVIPLGIAESYRGLGDYAAAETSYLQAAAYAYLNVAIEAPYLWLRLAGLYLEWGDSLFRNGDAPSALPVYTKVIAVDKSAPAASPLFATASLKPGADPGRTVIANLDALVAGTATAASLDVNPLLAAAVLDVWQQIRKIGAGLDFWGIWAPSVPLWTFDYLQGVAVNFAQLAMSAEKDMIDYWDRADQGTLTRDQLTQNAAQAEADQFTAKMQQNASLAEVGAYGVAATLAVQRATDAQANATEYGQQSELANEYQALSTQMQGGDDPDLGAILGSSFFIAQPSDVENAPNTGSGGTGAAIAQYMASSATSQYEIDALGRTAAELQTAAQQAQKEVEAAAARNDVANAAAAAAKLRTQHAKDMVSAFDAQLFTPDVWKQMGDAMQAIYRRYLWMALYAARQMQQAYNFETDQALAIIKSNYSSNEIKGTLAAESLMADVQTFTYELITTTTSKPQPLKQTISLAARFGFAFENQFRKTGVMDFETRIDDFDLAYPGTYAGRIQTLEVEISGLIPMSGVSGTLTNGGISFFRVPSPAWPPQTSGLKARVQSAETLVLSDYRVRNDALVFSPDLRMLGIMQGAGVVSSWRLEIPRGVNDLDYGTITDVLLTFTYTARYDPQLRDLVLAQLATIPALNTAQRGLPLRWVYPDAYFHFQDTGTFSVTLGPGDFPRFQTQPQLLDVGVLVSTDGSVAAAGLKLGLSTPAHAAITGSTDAGGAIQAGAAGSPWQPLAAGTALGPYTLTMTAADNPALVKGGVFSLAPVINIALITKYSFTRRA